MSKQYATFGTKIDLHEVTKDMAPANNFDPKDRSYLYNLGKAGKIQYYYVKVPGRKTRMPMIDIPEATEVLDERKAKAKSIPGIKPSPEEVKNLQQGVLLSNQRKILETQDEIKSEISTIRERCDVFAESIESIRLNLSSLCTDLNVGRDDVLE